MLDVVGVHEVAEMITSPTRPGQHVWPESVTRWVALGVLTPDVVLACGPIWRRTSIVDWATETGRGLFDG